MGVEQTWHDEMKQRPEFLHIVLNGCAREQQTIPAVEAQADSSIENSESS